MLFWKCFHALVSTLWAIDILTKLQQLLKYPVQAFSPAVITHPIWARYMTTPSQTRFYDVTLSSHRSAYSFSHKTLNTSVSTILSNSLWWVPLMNEKCTWRDYSIVTWPSINWCVCGTNIYNSVYNRAIQQQNCFGVGGRVSESQQFGGRHPAIKIITVCK